MVALKRQNIDYKHNNLPTTDDIFESLVNFTNEFYNGDDDDKILNGLLILNVNIIS